ncbi:MAG: DUF1822 family protein [Roseofilum sp. SBFL]|uniref:DUF1822 family protein n=2 Tax=unclassified Roseofilum TaxID=2620099 RepID=UPI001B18720C|nr:DUF1822 family protein [Roseofilum sp. SBFL]MBP0043961.1 DUF1822 family protein [Roseofilum sp. SBFL]
MSDLNSNSNVNSTALVFQGDNRAYEKLQALWQSGKLEQMLGFPVAQVGLLPEIPNLNSQPHNLGQWLKGSLFRDGWRMAQGTLVTLLNLYSPLASAYRSPTQARLNELTSSPDSPANRTDLEELLQQAASDRVKLAVIGKIIDRDPENAVALEALKLLLANRSEHIRRLAAFYLGQCTDEDSGILEALVEQIRQEEDSEACWQMAMSLGQIAPEHPEAAIAQTKAIQLGSYPLVLLVALKLSQAQSDQIDIFLQVKQQGEEPTNLPEGLELVVLDSNGNKVPRDSSSSEYLEKVALADDICLPLELYGSPGEEFTVSLKYQEDRIAETFII